MSWAMIWALLILLLVPARADYPFDDVTPPTMNISSYENGEIVAEATDDVEVTKTELQVYPSMATVCAYDAAGNIGVESVPFHNSPGTIITLTAHVSYWKIFHMPDGWDRYVWATADYSKDLVVVSPVYREHPVYSDKDDSLLIGMLRRRITKTGETLTGIQLLDGGLFVDGVTYPKTMFRGEL